MHIRISIGTKLKPTILFFGQKKKKKGISGRKHKT